MVKPRPEAVNIVANNASMRQLGSRASQVGISTFQIEIKEHLNLIKTLGEIQMIYVSFRIE